MVEGVSIENFKSIEKLKFKLARLNVFIGANGAGKTNIFEAITFGAAASANKLDTEFLSSRGIRVTEPELMRSAFEKNYNSVSIMIYWVDKEIHLGIHYDGINHRPIISRRKDHKEIYEEIHEVFKENMGLDAFIEKSKELFIDKNSVKQYNFLNYSPVEKALRKFEDNEKIQPLGINGEGLFKLLKEMSDEELSEIKENLQLLDWFEDMEIPNGLLSMEKRLNIKDRFIASDIEYFDHKSTNEGFLFLLFYLALVISKKTPKFFAIDNIDNALNPKLCIQIIQTLSQLAEKHDKQILLSTHNPSILDGLNLENKNEKLFVVYRNAEGRTKLKKIDSSNFNTNGNVRLSEAFIRGYIGGLNKYAF